MSDRRIKGANLVQIVAFIDERYSHADRQRIYAQLSDELKAKLKSIEPSEWYPVDDENALEAAMAKVAPSEEEAEKTARELGHFIFKAALGTFMRLVLRVLTPAMFLKKTRDIWPRMFDFGSFEADASMMQDNKAQMIMRGVEGCDYFPAVSAGFIEAAVEAIGFEKVKVDYRPAEGEPEGNFRFYVEWA